MLKSINPTTNELVATVQGASLADYNRCVDAAVKAQKEWRVVSTQIFETRTSFLKTIFFSSPPPSTRVHVVVDLLRKHNDIV